MVAKWRSHAPAGASPAVGDAPPALPRNTWTGANWMLLPDAGRASTDGREGEWRGVWGSRDGGGGGGLPHQLPLPGGPRARCMQPVRRGRPPCGAVARRVPAQRPHQGHRRPADAAVGRQPQVRLPRGGSSSTRCNRDLSAMRHPAILPPADDFATPLAHLPLPDAHILQGSSAGRVLAAAISATMAALLLIHARCGWGGAGSVGGAGGVQAAQAGGVADGDGSAGDSPCDVHPLHLWPLPGRPRRCDAPPAARHCCAAMLLSLLLLLQVWWESR